MLVFAKMEITRKSLIWMILRTPLVQQQCTESLRETFGIEASSEKTVYNYVTKLRHGDASVSDECCPKSVVVQNNMVNRHNMIEEDRHMTYKFSLSPKSLPW